jgi:predicted ribosome quality control (RQC) complex YloA/Tae2 family protein
MSYELSSLDLHYLVEELQALKGARVDKIYSPQRKELLFQLFMTGPGKRMLRINAPAYIYLSDFKEDQPERPSGFCTLLRKYLDNTRLREINQLGFERIIELVFEGKEESYRLFAELFSKGNIVLCKEDYTIIMPAEYQEWKGRSIRPKLRYLFPKKSLDFLTLTEKELKEAAESSGKSIVKLLATDIGLGGKYAEELCAISGVPKEREKLEEGDLKKLIGARKRLLSEKISTKIYFEGGSIKAAAPFGLTTLDALDGLETREFQSYNEALDYAFSGEIAAGSDSKKLSRHQAKIERLLKIIKSQEEYLAELEKEIKEESGSGEAIYTNYQMISDILKELNRARSKYSLREMREKVKGNKLVKDIKEKEKSVVLEL